MTPLAALPLLLGLGGPPDPGRVLPPCGATIPAGEPCRAMALPPCAPGLAPGTACVWPEVEVLPVRSGPMNITRLVAVVYGPRLIEVPEDTLRYRREITLTDEYASCSAGVAWREEVSRESLSHWTCPAGVRK